MRTIRHLALLAVAAVAVACASDKNTAPPEPAVGAAIGAATTAPTCDPTFVRANADAQAFFASSSDPIFALLQTMRTQYQSGGPRAATNTGFDALHRIADIRLTSRQGGTAVAGDALTKDLLVCMSVGGLPPGFSVVAALGSGIYEVRGGTTDVTAPALAKTLVAGQRSLTSPVWGIEPINTWDGRFERRQTRFLVYGAPLPVNTFTRDPVSTDPNNVAYTGFDISTIPVMPRLSLVHANGSAAPVRVGICIDPAPGGNPNLLVHAGSADTTILRLTSPTFCATFADADLAPHGVLATLAHGALSLFTPTPALALVGGVGGLPSGLSPFGPVKVSVDDITLTFTQQPSTTGAGAAISPPVRVQARTENGTPIGGVRITLHVLRSDGSDAGVTVGTQETTSDLPSAPGIANFGHLAIPTSGTYTLRATGTMNGTATLTATSSAFVVQ